MIKSFNYQLSKNIWRLVSNDNLETLTINRKEFCWIHNQMCNPSDYLMLKNWLSAFIDIDELALEEFLSNDAQPIYKKYQSGHLLIIRCINPSATHGVDEMVPLHIWIKEKTIISISNADIYAVYSLKNDIDTIQIKTRSHFLISLFTRIIERISEVIDQIDDSIDSLDTGLDESELNISLDQIILLRKRLLSLRRFINPQKDLLDKVLKGTGINYNESQNFFFRDLSGRYYKIVDDIDHMRDKLSLISESANNKRNEAMNKTMYLLSVVASLFLPLGFITGLFGINVGGMPGTNSNSAFGILTLICGLILIVEIFILKIRKII